MQQVRILRNEALGKTIVKKLKQRGFEAFYCVDKQAALLQVLQLIPAENVVSWGGSVTLAEIEILETVKKRNPVIDRDTAKTLDEKVEIMRKSLLCDTFLMSSNAVSADGQLVNIDGNGNRVAALCYGPKQVIVIVGLNKVAGSLEAAMDRVRNIAAPINVQRFADAVTPCKKTGLCSDCQSADSICAQIVVTRRSRPEGRIKVILVGENLGF